MANTPRWMDYLSRIADGWDDGDRSSASDIKDRGVMCTVAMFFYKQNPLTPPLKKNFLDSIDKRLGKKIVWPGEIKLTYPQWRYGKESGAFDRIFTKISGEYDAKVGDEEITLATISQPFSNDLASVSHHFSNDLASISQKRSSSTLSHNGLEPLTERNETKSNETDGRGSHSLTPLRPDLTSSSATGVLEYNGAGARGPANLALPPRANPAAMEHRAKVMVPPGLQYILDTKAAGLDVDPSVLKMFEPTKAVVVPAPKTDYSDINALDPREIIEGYQLGEIPADVAQAQLALFRQAIYSTDEYQRFMPETKPVWLDPIPRGVPGAHPTLHLQVWLQEDGSVNGSMACNGTAYNVNFTGWDPFEDDALSCDGRHASNHTWRKARYAEIGEHAHRQWHDTPKHHRSMDVKYMFSGLYHDRDFKRDQGLMVDRFLVLLNWENGRPSNVLVWNGEDQHVIPLKMSTRSTKLAKYEGRI